MHKIIQSHFTCVLVIILWI